MYGTVGTFDSYCGSMELSEVLIFNLSSVEISGTICGACLLLAAAFLNNFKVLDLFPADFSGTLRPL